MTSAFPHTLPHVYFFFILYKFIIPSYLELLLPRLIGYFFLILCYLANLTHVICTWMVPYVSLVPKVGMSSSDQTSKYKSVNYNIPYARHYKPRLVYFFTPFPTTIYVLWPLALCMACIQERLLIKSGLWWRGYGRYRSRALKRRSVLRAALGFLRLP